MVGRLVPASEKVGNKAARACCWICVCSSFGPGKEEPLLLDPCCGYKPFFCFPPTSPSPSGRLPKEEAQDPGNLWITSYWVTYCFLTKLAEQRNCLPRSQGAVRMEQHSIPSSAVLCSFQGQTPRPNNRECCGHRRVFSPGKM